MYKVPEANTHVPHHTQRENDTTNGGGAEGAAPIGTIARPLCVWCECWRSFVWHEYRIYRIYKIYRV